MREVDVETEPLPGMDGMRLMKGAELEEEDRGWDREVRLARLITLWLINVRVQRMKQRRVSLLLNIH